MVGDNHSSPDTYCADDDDDVEWAAELAGDAESESKCSMCSLPDASSD